jgi:hypothetical protein
MRGHSSAGRAPALQAGGHRFESGCLQTKSGVRVGHDEVMRLRVMTRSLGFKAGLQDCTARKGHEIVAPSFSEGTGPLTLIAVMPVILFFVRVNQVLVRLWARAMEAAACPCSSRCPVDV